MLPTNVAFAVVKAILKDVHVFGTYDTYKVALTYMR